MPVSSASACCSAGYLLGRRRGDQCRPGFTMKSGKCPKCASTRIYSRKPRHVEGGSPESLRLSALRLCRTVYPGCGEEENGHRGASGSARHYLRSGEVGSTRRNCPTTEGGAGHFHAKTPCREIFPLLPLRDLANFEPTKQKTAWQAVRERYNLRRPKDLGFWGISSVGRAPQWHCGGQRFESAMLHHLPRHRKIRRR